MPKRIVIFSGAGMSAESGISTFRDTGGLWERYKIEDVATPEAFARNPTLVLDFYNRRRRQIAEVSPNAAHLAAARLQEKFETVIITQNIDDLHERAGASQVIHLHGEITKARSSTDPDYVVDIGYKDIHLGDLCPTGGQLRPHIVWFGEEVPMMDAAVSIISNCDILITVGTSLKVYPAAGLIYSVSPSCKHYYIDSNAAIGSDTNFKVIRSTAGAALPPLVEQILLMD
jgi:NAD-dependent deacetylase